MVCSQIVTCAGNMCYTCWKYHMEVLTLDFDHVVNQMMPCDRHTAVPYRRADKTLVLQNLDPSLNLNVNFLQQLHAATAPIESPRIELLRHLGSPRFRSKRLNLTLEMVSRYSYHGFPLELDLFEIFNQILTY